MWLKKVFVKRAFSILLMAVWVWPGISATLQLTERSQVNLCECLPAHCRCPHQHAKTDRLSCHFPRGERPTQGPRIASCRTDEPVTQALPQFLFSRPMTFREPDSRPIRLVRAFLAAIQRDDKPPTPPPRYLS